MRTLKYIISLISIPFFALAQSEETKPKQAPKQKIIRDFVPSEFTLGVDVVGISQTLLSGQSRWEVVSKVDFHHFYLAAEVGWNNLQFQGGSSQRTFQHTSSGTFFRLGPQANLTPYNPYRSSIFFGLMYAASSFQDHLIYTQSGSLWGDLSRNIHQQALSARWFEANLGINVKIVGPLYLGYTVRFKFAKTLKGFHEAQPLEIPGYGGADKASLFGFNYHIIYKLRFRNKPIPKRPVKPDKSSQNSSQKEK